MAIDPLQLTITELTRLANSTALGTVISRAGVYAHFTKAGFRISSKNDPKCIDLRRYAAWLANERHRPRDRTAGKSYEDKRDYIAQRDRALSESRRNIGDLPAIVDPVRHQRCADSFRLFCETYFPNRFQQHGAFWPWSDDHLTVMSMIERVVREGGQFAVAMPRGSGKTVLCECAVMWAVLYGYHSFVGIFGPNEDHARERIKSFKSMLVSPVLAEDFPHACYPIIRLEGINQRRLIYNDQTIHIDFKSDTIQLPNIPGPSCGSVIYAAGLTGQIRGPNVTRDDGSVMRPSLVLIDDPQTRESAKSAPQCATREQIINGDVLGLAGPGEDIAAMIPCTVIYQNDLADRLLNREINPQWQGVRTSMVTAWPTNTGLWSRYAEIRKEAHLACAGDRRLLAERCNAFYQQNREAMDEGCATSWGDRKLPLELSAIQHAWNLRIDRSDHVFFAEYQNEPLPDVEVVADMLTADEIAAKVNGLKRGIVPVSANRLTMFVDVQGNSLWWVIAAWDESFTGYVIDYGTEPEQRVPYFTLGEMNPTLLTVTPRAGIEGQWFAGLERLTERTLGREFRREDGAMLRIDRCLIDANYGNSTDLVYQFCRQSVYANLLAPSHGKYVGPSSIPMAHYRKKPGDRIGLNWRMPALHTKRTIRHVLYDTNYWKSFVQARFATAMGDPGCLSLFGRDATRHRMFADQMVSEQRTREQKVGSDRIVDIWRLKMKGLDNHWFDCLVGCAVAASMVGCRVEGMDSLPVKKPRRKISLAEAMGRA